jgi:hypothetical protein
VSFVVYGRRRILPFFAALVMACSAPSEPPLSEETLLEDLTAFHRALHDVACENVRHCEHRWTRTFSPNAAHNFWSYWFGLDDSLEACKARYGMNHEPFFELDWTASAVLAGRVAFDRSAVEGCLSDLAAGICDGTHRLARLPAACRAVLSPRVRPGGPCDHPMECAGGSTCDTGPDPFCGGICDGGPLACGCTSDEYCLQGRCFSYLSPGQPCSNGDRCVPTAGCEPSSGLCVSYHSYDAGEACTTSDYCRPELACVNGACVPIAYAPSAEPCNGRDILCQLGTVCVRENPADDPHCTRAPGEGAPCTAGSSLSCRAGLRCLDGTCHRHAGEGELCREDDDCISRLCHHGRCAAGCADVGL